MVSNISDEWISWRRNKDGSVVSGEYQIETAYSSLRMTFTLRWKKKKVFVSIKMSECRNDKNQYARIDVCRCDRNHTITNQAVWNCLRLIVGAPSEIKKKKIWKLLRKKYFNIDSFYMKKSVRIHQKALADAGA
jgi:hypothetical protein